VALEGALLIMMSGKYRSVFHSPLTPGDAFTAARDELRTWLREKQYDLAAFDNGNPKVGHRATVLRNAANSADGAQTERWQLREPGADGDWLSTLTVHAPALASDTARTWFWVEIEFDRDGASRSGTPPQAGVPRLVRRLLERASARDSLAQLTAEPRVVGIAGIDELIDILCDPERRLPAVVAAAHREVAFEEWRRTITQAMRFLPGLASLHILDPLATDAFQQEIGRSHAVWAGALRTYLPDVDPAVSDEAARHRVLSAARIAEDPRRAAAILSVLPRRLSLEAPIPASLSGANRSLLTQARRPAPDADERALREQMTLLITERDTALVLAEEQELRANALFSERASALAELAERQQQVLELSNQVRALQRRLVAAGRSQEAFAPVAEPESPPGGFAELLDWVGASLPRITFTGNADVTLSLDQRPESTTWARTSWEVLRALQAYAEAKAGNGFSGDFKIWCQSPPGGESAIPAGKVVRDESETVRHNAKWRRQREFPVPCEIDPAGKVFMGAHIRIGASSAGQINPRLYLHDATAQTGHVYVGYLGPHLTNTRS
jgi:hypothetical protein